MSHQAPLEWPLGNRDLFSFEKSKTAPSTGNIPGFFEDTNFSSGKKRQHDNRRLRWHEPLITFAGNCLVADERMVFQFYGLNGARMPQSVPFEQQTNRKRQSCGRDGAQASGAVKWEKETAERFVPLDQPHFRLGEAEPIAC